MPHGWHDESNELALLTQGADFPISDLRDVDRLLDRLSEVHQLRIKRRNETVGILFDTERARAIVGEVQRLQSIIERLQQQLEERDDEALAVLSGERLARPEQEDRPGPGEAIGALLRYRRPADRVC